MKADEAGIVISGRRWSASDFVRADGTPGPWTSKALEADPLSFKAELGRFLTEFFSPGASVTVHTSGSTGAPKAFAAEKSRMRASARATIAFLGLKPGSTNLLAMPLRFIAGKMVVVRSAECGLNLIPVEPCANPFLEHPEAADLCALTPMQAATVLANPATSRFLLESRAVILGGGPVDEELTAKLQSAKGAVYASYGMTETLSHVALRRLNGPTADAGFRALPGVTISLSALNTLQIDAPAVAAETLITHDRARFNPDGTFSLIGRLDNVINTGAVKIQIEEVEAKLKPFISGRFTMNTDRCVGCKYCIAACPYNARWINPETKVADNCDFCLHSKNLAAGELPGCVAHCRFHALSFGDLNDPNSFVSKLLKAKDTVRIRPWLGTEPTLRYIPVVKTGVR